MSRRRGVLLAIVALGAVGCAASPNVVVTARGPITATPAPTVPRPASIGAAAPTATTTGAVPTTTVAPPTIATHDAHLHELPTPATIVPVAIDAGGSAISGPVVPAGVDAVTGELALPAEAQVVAWYQYGPTPGEGGSAVLAGHVDWHGVPGTFFRLRQLQPGDTVDVTMSDGSVRHFNIVDVHLVAKPDLPVSDVFTRAGPPTLTLITCGGSFDKSTHHYRSNVVVTALPA